jgi:hypothetical protein
MKTYNSLILALLALGSCATALAMHQEAVKKEHVRFVGGVPIMQKSMSAHIKRISQQLIPTQKKDSPSWLNPFSKMASYICYPYRAYQQNKLNKKFAQAVEAHILAIKDKNKKKAQSTLGPVKNLLAQGANPETEVIVPDDPFEKDFDRDPFAANRGIFRTYSQPLYAAVEANTVNLVKLLIENKADIDKGIGHLTPLTIAVCNNFDAAAYLLLNKNASIHKAEQLSTPLTPFLTKYKNILLASELLQRGASVGNNLAYDSSDDDYSDDDDDFFFTRSVFKHQNEAANTRYLRHLAAEDVQYKRKLKYVLNNNVTNSPALPPVICDLIMDYVPKNTIAKK